MDSFADLHEFLAGAVDFDPRGDGRDFEEAGDEDVIRKLLGDLTAAGINVDEAEVRRALDEKQVEARRQLMESR